MVDNDDAGCLNARVVPAFFASRLAPTEKLMGVHQKKSKKTPQKRGRKGCSSHAFGRLSITWQALPSERLIEWKGCKTIRELIPI